MLQTAFYKGYSSGPGVEISLLPVFHFRPEIAYTLFRKQGLSLKTDLGVSIFGPASHNDFKVSMGYGYDVGLSVLHKLTNENTFHCRVYFATRKQSTSILQLTEPQAGMGCGYTFGGLK